MPAIEDRRLGREPDQKRLCGAALLLSLAMVMLLAAKATWGQEIVSLDGEVVRVSVGSKQGVKVGMTGFVISTEEVSGQSVEVRIASFVVSSVAEAACVVSLERSTGPVSVGMKVRFEIVETQKPTRSESEVDGTLRSGSPETGERPKANPSTQPRVEAAVLLDQANRLLDLGDSSGAHTLFKQFVEDFPDNPNRWYAERMASRLALPVQGAQKTSEATLQVEGNEELTFAAGAPSAPKPLPHPESGVGHSRSTGATQPPRIIRMPPLAYPQLARRLRKEATVMLRVLVDESGQVRQVQSIGGKHGFGFDDAAAAHVRDCEWAPASRDGVSVEMWVEHSVVFSLEGTRRGGSSTTADSGDATAPVLMSIAKPQYPPMARRMKIEGAVVVSVLIDEDGRVVDVRLESGISQDVGLNEAAIETARTARFRPATRQGASVMAWYRLTIPFKL